MAVLNEGETRELTLSPGDHEVWIKLDWTRSPKLKLKLAEATRTHLQCRAGGGAWMEPIDASFRLNPLYRTHRAWGLAPRADVDL